MSFKVEIVITDEVGNIHRYDVSDKLQTLPKMSLKESYWYHTHMASATLYPGKTWDEVEVIIQEHIKKYPEIYDL